MSESHTHYITVLLNNFYDVTIILILSIEKDLMSI